MSIRSIDIVATFPDHEYRFLSGERLVQFAEDFFEPPQGEDDRLGRLGLLERPLPGPSDRLTNSILATYRVGFREQLANTSDIRSPSAASTFAAFRRGK